MIRRECSIGHLYWTLNASVLDAGNPCWIRLWRKCLVCPPLSARTPSRVVPRNPAKPSCTRLCGESEAPASLAKSRKFAENVAYFFFVLNPMAESLLRNLQCRSAKPRATVYRLNDGGGGHNGAYRFEVRNVDVAAFVVLAAIAYFPAACQTASGSIGPRPATGRPDRQWKRTQGLEGTFEFRGHLPAV